VFPWWDNEASGFFPCTTAEQAADFHLARLDEVRRTYPRKEVIITEFGWPHAPEGGSLTNSYTQQKCGVASVANQKQVVASTLKKLVASHQSGVVFEAFSENWKARHEGGFGGSWGICQGKPPYHCIENLMQ
jgi:exo-beta-1,3-glucanase (GH17 family)